MSHWNRRAARVSVWSSVLLTGCAGYYPGGPMESLDQYTYESTPDFPQTIMLVNHTTGETLWTMPVPIGQKLVMRFRKGENKGDPARPDVMHWEVIPSDKFYDEVLDNSMPVPASHSRMVNVEMRPAEAPASGR